MEWERPLSSGSDTICDIWMINRRRPKENIEMLFEASINSIDKSLRDSMARCCVHAESNADSHGENKNYNFEAYFRIVIVYWPAALCIRCRYIRERETRLLSPCESGKTNGIHSQLLISIKSIYDLKTISRPSSKSTEIRK